MNIVSSCCFNVHNNGDIDLEIIDEDLTSHPSSIIHHQYIEHHHHLQTQTLSPSYIHNHDDVIYHHHFLHQHHHVPLKTAAFVAGFNFSLRQTPFAFSSSFSSSSIEIYAATSDNNQGNSCGFQSLSLCMNLTSSEQNYGWARALIQRIGLF